MLSKDTIRLIVQFRDFNGNMIDPNDVNLKIYDLNEQLIEEIGTEKLTDNAQGNYHYDYVTPDHDFIFEFEGQYFDKPVLSRQKVSVKFNY